MSRQMVTRRRSGDDDGTVTQAEEGDSEDLAESEQSEDLAGEGYLYDPAVEAHADPMVGQADLGERPTGGGSGPLAGGLSGRPVSVAVVGSDTPDPGPRRVRRGRRPLGVTPAAPAGGGGGRSAPQVDEEGRLAADRPRARTGVTAGAGAGAGAVRRSVAVVLVATSVLCAVAAVGFGLAWASLQGQQDTNRQVQAAARVFVLDLTNMTPSTVDARINDLLDASTGQFASQARSFFGGSIRQELERAQPVEQGQIRSLDVESVAGANASVFAVVDDSYDNPALKASGQGRQSDVLRLDLGMCHTATGWKVATVTVLDGPSGGVLATPGNSPAPTSAGSVPSGAGSSGSTP